MTSSSQDEPSWSLDMPGLTRQHAEELVSFAKDTGISIFATAVDPDEFLTLHLDRDTVESLLRGVVDASSGGAGQPGGLVSLDGVKEALADWLNESGGSA
jgi:hypothetical protein